MNFSCEMAKFGEIYVQKWKTGNLISFRGVISVANRDLDRVGFARKVADGIEWKETFSGGFCNIYWGIHGGSDLKLHNTCISYLLGVGLFHLGKLAEDKSSGEYVVYGHRGIFGVTGGCLDSEFVFQGNNPLGEKVTSEGK